MAKFQANSANNVNSDDMKLADALPEEPQARQDTTDANPMGTPFSDTFTKDTPIETSRSTSQQPAE